MANVSFDYTAQKKLLPDFLKLQVEQARSFFFEGVYWQKILLPLEYITSILETSNRSFA